MSFSLSFPHCSLYLLSLMTLNSLSLSPSLSELIHTGNSTGYANALALLEQYVPVTGFINGVFGAVAGAACMVS
jgi:hypothetical protein